MNQAEIRKISSHIRKRNKNITRYMSVSLSDMPAFLILDFIRFAHRFSYLLWYEKQVFIYETEKYALHTLTS